MKRESFIQQSTNIYTETSDIFPWNFFFSMKIFSLFQLYLYAEWTFVSTFSRNLETLKKTVQKIEKRQKVRRNSHWTNDKR